MTVLPQASLEELDAAALATLARDCRLAGVERQVLLLRLSRLPFDYFRPHHARLAEGAFEPLARADRARLYRLPGHDLALAWRGEAAPQESQVLSALSILFAEPEGRLPALSELVRRFILPRDAERLAACLAVPESSPPPTRNRPPLDPAALFAIERALASADMARFARRRPVSRRDATGRLTLAWEKRFLSVAEIGESLAPEHDLAADPWLFRRLTLTLDRRMLALLSAPGELAHASPFAINLNVESILSPAFLSFDAALPAALRGAIVLDLLPADILNDAAAFLFARDFARGRGYRLAVRGLTAALLPILPLAPLGLDLMAVRHSPELAALPPAVLDQAAPDRTQILLTRVDSAAALAWGTEQDLVLFQGRAALPIS